MATLCPLASRISFLAPLGMKGCSLAICSGSAILSRVISDISTCNMHPGLKNLLKNDGMISMVFCGLEGRSGETFGYLLFNQFDRKRKWSRKETNTFKYLAKILSASLSEKYAKHEIIAEGIENLPLKNED